MRYRHHFETVSDHCCQACIVTCSKQWMVLMQHNPMVRGVTMHTCMPAGNGPAKWPMLGSYEVVLSSAQLGASSG